MLQLSFVSSKFLVLQDMDSIQCCQYACLIIYIIVVNMPCLLCSTCSIKFELLKFNVFLLQQRTLLSLQQHSSITKFVICMQLVFNGGSIILTGDCALYYLIIFCQASFTSSTLAISNDIFVSSNCMTYFLLLPAACLMKCVFLSCVPLILELQFMLDKSGIEAL